MAKEQAPIAQLSMTLASEMSDEIYLDNPTPIFNEGNASKPIRVAGVVTTGTYNIDPNVLQSYLDDTILKSISTKIT